MVPLAQRWSSVVMEFGVVMEIHYFPQLLAVDRESENEFVLPVVLVPVVLVPFVLMEFGCSAALR